MAITSADFGKIWASTSPLTPYSFSESNYKTGWNFVGATPPSRQMWDYIQKQNDEKAQYLFEKVEQTAIPYSADLNDYTSYGNYYSASDSNAQSLVNCPVNASFNMMIGRAGAGVLQWVCSGGSVFVRKKTSSSWNMWHQMLDCYAGGTVTGTITEEMDYPSTRPAYTVQYTSLESGVAPSSTRQGYLLRVLDSSGSTSIGGLFYYVNNSGTNEFRLYNNWHTQFYVRLYSSSGGQSFLPGADNSIDLGGSSYRWKQIYAGTSTINTSDERVKDNIEPIDDAVLDAWGEVGWYQFQFKDAIAKKGENARIHTGTIAQRIKETFEKHNLDAFRYGLLCHDSWDETEEEKDENGKVTQEYRPAGDLYSLRYEEALCMEASYQRRRADRLEARLNALEERIARLEVK